jgi:protease inhibitor Inh
MVAFAVSWKQLRMKSCGVIIVGVLAASLCGGVSFAQVPQSQTPGQAQPQSAPPLQPQSPPPPNGLSDAANAMIGAWEFSNADHDRICHFTFRTDAVAGGYKLDVDKNCPNLFPSTANIVAWSLDNYGDLRLLDADGKEVVELSEVEGGMYDGFTPEEGRYILQTAAAAPTLTAADMVGDWAVARGAGKPICLLTLTNNPAGDALALTVKPGCDAFVMAFAPSAWRMDQGALVLLSAHGQNWQFEENDAKTWQRVPETANPILLMRQ